MEQWYADERNGVVWRQPLPDTPDIDVFEHVIADVWGEPIEDNTRLIASAPELKEQRDELLEALEFLMDHVGEEWAWERARAAVDRARRNNE